MRTAQAPFALAARMTPQPTSRSVPHSCPNRSRSPSPSKMSPMQNSSPESLSSRRNLLEMLERELSQRLSHNRLTDYKPYPKQAEFHAAGGSFRERLLMAGNQL